ncbi:YcxB family protein [Chitinophagaceae bacterium LWZ2-11]
MQHSFSYDKPKTIQALRYHFISRTEIRLMFILVNVFAVVAAILFYTKKIRPEPFFLGTFIWILMIASIWYILPYTIYKRAATFKESFTIYFYAQEIKLTNEKGFIEWPWVNFSKWFESPHFFHLYFDSKSFFLVPKDGMTDDMRHELRALFKEKIIKK